MRLLIWLLSRKRQKPRPPGWSIENQELWDGLDDERARVKWMTDHRNQRLEEETP